MLQTKPDTLRRIESKYHAGSFFDEPEIYASVEFPGEFVVRFQGSDYEVPGAYYARSHATKLTWFPSIELAVEFSRRYWEDCFGDRLAESI